MIELNNADIEAMPEFQEVAEGLDAEERSMLILEFKKQIREIKASMKTEPKAGRPIREVQLPPHTKYPRFTLDLSYLETKWAHDTKLTIRMGDNPPVIIDSPHRLLAPVQTGYVTMVTIAITLIVRGKKRCFVYCLCLKGLLQIL